MVPRVLPVSTANAAFQRLEVLQRNRTKRHRYGEFVVEGVRAINGALAAGWIVRAFAYPRGRTLSRWASSILERSGADSSGRAWNRHLRGRRFLRSQGA